MAKTKAASSKSQPSPDYPQGKHTVTFTDIDEEDWWLITNLFKGRIDYFNQRLQEIQHSKDPDLIRRNTEWLEETIERLETRLYQFEDQISPTYFKRKRAEHAARNKQQNK
jgi:hypothetical protein